MIKWEILEWLFNLQPLFVIAGTIIVCFLLWQLNRGLLDGALSYEEALRRLEGFAKSAESASQDNVNSTDVERSASTANIAPAASATAHRCIYCGHSDPKCVFIPAQCTHCTILAPILDKKTGKEIPDGTQ